MRLAAQIKGGYYACPLPVVDIACERLSAPDGRFSIFDPCCGQAHALARITENLGCDERDVHGCELSPDLARDAKLQLPKSRIVGPADFLSLSVTDGSMAFGWVNPPFDQDESGGRAESIFVSKALEMIAPNGVIAVVAPEHVFDNYHLSYVLRSECKKLSMMVFPKEHRRFKEAIVFGVKVSSYNDPEQDDKQGAYGAKLSDFTTYDGMYDIPLVRRDGSRFHKLLLTEYELKQQLAKSPLYTVLREPTIDKPLPRPPLPLGEGHIALLLASGHMNGLISPPNEPPHVIRGTAKKVRYVDRVEESETSTTTVYKERPVIVIRAVDHNAEIITISDEQEGDTDVNSDNQQEK